MGVNKISKLASNEWKEIKEKYEGAQLAEFLMIQYVKLGGYVEMEKAFKAKKANFREIVSKYRDEIYNDKPYLVDLFDDRVRYNRYEKPKEVNEVNDNRKKFNKNMFETLPCKLEYTSFIDLMCEYNTQEKSVYELIRIAGEYGTKVFEIVKGREKIIKC